MTASPLITLATLLPILRRPPLSEFSRDLGWEICCRTVTRRRFSDVVVFPLLLFDEVVRLGVTLFSSRKLVLV